jgi:N-acetyl-1-D-myo-inositol-2-amino-2-deoxy-alpha-D-glucopyranoside deacetylase
MDPLAGRRLLLVHAHPDDESIETGATMAAYAAAGAAVTLVTCTLGELGEVIPPALAYLTAGSGAALGAHRTGELAAACAALGVRDHRFLGGAGRWRDSGMMGLPDNDAPGCFWQADVAEAAALLAGVIRDVRPQVVVTYDERGFYGHPDHIQAHRVTRRAIGLAAAPQAPPAPPHVVVPHVGAAPVRAAAVRAAADAGPAAGTSPAPWRVAKFYATAMPLSVLAEAIQLGDAPPAGFTRVCSVADLPFGVPDDQVTTEIDGTAYLDSKAAAMRAHATQIAVAGEFFALSDLVGQRVAGREFYTLLAGPRGPGAGPHGYEQDLFAGL